ncbi:MAG: hypothetical protein F4Z68_05975, partial [Nitrospira sp. SB0667_bin_9]|nr:hypothetical protein [Nitrospira sp. SB0667_bin_9]MYD31979.1 hypothetical protein [Nitrospira sp. SB0661_bin_20]MYJ23762.1 hypothetical protein [Nitrospira sp. SB0673_bin_12]
MDDPIRKVHDRMPFHFPAPSLNHSAVTASPAGLVFRRRRSLLALSFVLLLLAFLSGGAATAAQTVSTVTITPSTTQKVEEGTDIWFTAHFSPALAYHTCLYVAIESPQGTYGGGCNIVVDSGTTSLKLPPQDIWRAVWQFTSENDNHDPDGEHEYKFTLKPHGGDSAYGYQLGTPSSATILVSDNDPPPSVLVSIEGGAAVTEGGTATFALTTTPAPLAPITVNVDVTDSGDFAGAGQTGARTVNIGTNGKGSLTVTTVNDSTDEPNGTIRATLRPGTGYYLGPSWSSRSSVTVRDNDGPSVSITGGPSVTEGGKASFTLTATPAPSARTTVTVHVTDSGAFARAGQTGTRTVTIGRNGTGSLTVTTVNDSADEPNGTISAAVRDGTDYTVGSPASASVTVNDDDTADGPTKVNFSASNYNVTEGEAVTAELVLDRVRSHNVTFSVRTSGISARKGTDFGSGPFRVTVPANQLSQSFTVPTVEDSEAEGDERFTLHFVTGKFPSWLSTGQTGVATVTIDDDDTQVGFASPRYPVTEGATAMLTVAVKNGKQTEFMLGYTLVAGTASAADVTGGLTSGSVTVAADAASVRISVGTIQDGLAEGRESFTVELSTSESGVSFSRDRTKVVIEDDDPFPAVAFASAQRRVGEGAGTHNVTLQLAPAPAADLTLTYTVGGTATSGSDYAPLSGSLMVTAGSTAAAIPVTILDDATQDGRRDETVLLTLTGGTGYRVDAKNVFKLLIADNDPVPAVSFASASQAAGEGTGTRDVTLNLKPAPDADITVRYTVGGTASRGADYTALSGRITVPAGATAAAIPVTIADDTAVESSETIVLQLAAYDARFEIADENARHTLTIVDNDTLPEAWFASASQTADERSGTRDIVVNLTRAATSPVTVNYTVSGTATAGADYTPLSGQVTVSAGKATAAIPVTILDDSLLDQKETVVVALAAGTGYRVGKQDRHTLAIADNEPVPVVWFANHRAILSEGAGRYDFVVNLWPAPIVRTTLRYEVCRPSITHGAATPGSDYGALSGSLTVEPGTTTAAIPVTIIDDDVEEQTEALGLCLIEGTNYTFSPEKIKFNKADLLIDDDDSSRPVGPEAAFVSHASYAGEGSGTHKVKVRLSPAPASAITLNYTVDGNSTATAGSDYGALSGSVSVPAGATTVAIPVENREDTVRESFETVILLLTAGTGYTLNSDSQSHWLYILDNDGSTPAASFASASATAGEMSGVRNVTVNLTPAPASAITLNYTVGGTATAGAGNDFTIAGAGTVPVAANARTATIAVSIEDDATREGSETVVLTLSAGTGYAVGGSGTHTLTIIDDESPAPSSKTMVSFASASSSAGEGSGTRNVIVNFAPPPTSRIRLFVSTNTATTTATKPADYTVVGGDPNPRNPFIVRDIPAGTRSASLRVTIHDDGAQEADETVVLQLKGWGIMQRGSASPSQDTVGSPSLHTLTIVDDDGAAPPSMPVASFAAAASSNDEGSGTSKVTVNLSPAPKSDITLAYTVAGTATAGSDYGALSGTVPVKAGTAQAILPVTIANDSAAESPETVVLTLTAGTGYTVGSASTHTLTIADDDPSLTVSFASDASTAREASGTHAVTLNISPAPEANLTLVYTVGGTATPDADYTALPGTLAVSPGTTSVSLPVAIIDDSVEDSGETVVLTLSAGAGYRLGNPKEHRLTIVNRDAPMPDDEAAPVTVSLSAEQRAIAEAYGKTKFRITLSRTLEAGEVVKVPFTITGGKWKRDWHVKFQDAHNGPGVTRTQSGRKSAVRFTEGGRVATLVLVARPNEDTEARTIAIAFGTGTRPPRATGVTGGLALMDEPLAVAIIDDDRGMPAVTVAASDAVAEGRAASFTLNAGPAPAAALAVTVSINGTGDAVAPSALGERTVTLPGGTESQTFTVATVDDGTDGPGGSVTATVVKKAGYTLGETTAA